MEVLRQIQVGAVRYKKSDTIDVKALSKEQIKQLVSSGHLREKKGGK